MCLEQILVKDLPASKRSGIGYKAFNFKRRTNPIAKIFSKYKYFYTPILEQNIKRKLNVLYRASPSIIMINDEDFYEAGFHIFEKIEDAEKYLRLGVVCEVRFEGATCIGRNSMHDKGLTIVANKMKITKIIKETKPEYGSY